MKIKKDASVLSVARATAAALLIGVASSAAAADTATWDSTAFGGGLLTFDNIGVRQFANIDITGAGLTFNEQGFLAMREFSLGSGTPTFPGSTYSLYISFSGSGTQSAAPPADSTGVITSLSYSLYGDNNNTTFVANGVGVFSAVDANPLSAPVLLGTGSLAGVPPSTVSLTSGTPGATVYTTFTPTDPDPTIPAFFVTPASDVIIGFVSAFTNTPLVVTQHTVGLPLGTLVRFSINGGGGNANVLTPPVPEPQTYAMLLAGLGLMGFIARRRAKRDIS